MTIKKFLYRRLSSKKINYTYPKLENYIHKTEIFNRIPPIHLGSLHYKFTPYSPGIMETSEKTFVLALNNGKIYTSNGWVANEKNQVVLTTFSEFSSKPNKRVPFWDRPISINGVSLLLSARGSSDNYFHWLTDAFPKLKIADKGGIKLADVDHFIVSAKDKPFQQESLAALGIPLAKVISLTEHSYLKCERLIAPSDTCLSGNVSPWIVSWLRETFDGWMEKDESLPRKIFIERGDVGKRKLLNETEVRSFLSKRGFVNINPGALSMKEQVKIFFNALQIVGVHGAALTNVIFCKKNSKLVELFPVTYVNQCYWTIASQNDLTYGYLLGDGVDTTDPVHHLIDSDFSIDLKKLDELMDKMDMK